jgi:hypothetical protein
MPDNFMDKKSAVTMGLESLAVALIVTPEPVSTVVGISLLGYTRLTANQKEIVSKRNRKDFEDCYVYKIDLVNKATINYRIYPTRQGQLPSNWPNVANLCNRPELWNSYHATSSPRKQLTPYKPQPAGLLGSPKSPSKARFIAPKRTANQL